MKTFAADLIITNDGEPISNGHLVTTDDGIIVSIHERRPLSVVESFEGVLIPGFINTHCHLELSHLKGAISEKTGMTQFIQELLQKRNDFLQDEKEVAMLHAENEMYENGIVAVGDISNSNDSIYIKTQKKLYYHTFIELLGFNASEASNIFNKGMKLFQEFEDQFPKQNSMVPHAPYSMSNALLNLFSNHNNDLGIGTIHNEESIDEFEYCMTKSGAFKELYKRLNINDTDFTNELNKSPLEKIISYVDGYTNFQFVHNTFTKEEDIDLAQSTLKNIFWCFCPLANLYITNSLPDFNLFYRKDCAVTIGTDSLASNHQLSILEELKVISKAAPEIPFEKLIAWATINGAKFLNVDDRMGSIKVGHQPGILLLEKLNTTDLKLEANTKVRRLI
jgi:cytosine/adenosine deaminase-related metal-dependent hydrolase